jgi:putative FmdB family regulatory protein
MPLYEYQCDDCRTRFERLVRAWGEHVACPSCDSAAVTKQLSTFAMAATGGASSASSAGGSCCARGGCGCRH